MIEKMATNARYRKKIGCDTWHACTNCTQWPTENFISTTIRRREDEMCNECAAKMQLNTCRLSDEPAKL